MSLKNLDKGVELGGGGLSLIGPTLSSLVWDWPKCFLSLILKSFSDKKYKNLRLSILKIRWNARFWICDRNLFFLIKLVLLFQDFWVEPNFWESALFHSEMVGLTYFRTDISVCMVNVMISIQKYSSKVFSISFNKLLKVTTVWIIDNL